MQMASSVGGVGCESSMHQGVDEVHAIRFSILFVKGLDDSELLPLFSYPHLYLQQATSSVCSVQLGIEDGVHGFKSWFVCLRFKCKEITK